MAVDLTEEYPAAEKGRSESPKRKRTTLWVVLLGGALLLIGLFILFRVRAERAEKAAAGAAPVTGAAAPVDVSATVAVSQSVTSFIQTTGSLAGVETSDVASLASGKVIETPINVGAFVAQGTIIARLDDRDARLKLQQAQAAEQQAAAALRQAQARLGLGAGGRFDATAVPEVRAARQSYESAEAQARLAEANARRYENLVETGDVARSVFDQYRAQAETARAQANAARQQYEAAINTARQSNQGISGAQAALEAARAQTAQAQKAVSDTIIKAPLGGYVSDRPIAVGEYVTPSAKIATIVKTNPLKVNLQLPEAEAARVRVGLPVTLSVAAFPDREFTGRVTALNPAVDQTSRALTVEAQVENAANQLSPGMFVTARIAQPNASEGVFVPREAVLTDPATNSSSVFALEGETARVRVVQLGQEKDGLVQIVSGVKAGETVATSNLAQLFDGATVRR
jgi:multidrug efflux pump subunit AcrA (membrane-fusion protein)